ncbi:MAG TPA: SurA N-terminal domain-containing protein [Burkholderiaceae bacterium]
MFDFVRSHNRLLQVALGLLIIPSFAIFGVSSYTSSNNEASQAVASVDGRDISRAEWDAQHRKDVELIRQRAPQVDLKLLDTPEAQRRSLDTIVRERVTTAAIDHEHLAVSEDRALHEYQTNPEFAPQRAMSKQERDAWLADRRLTSGQLLANIAQSMQRQEATRGAADSGFMPNTTLKVSTDAWFDQREIQWQHFDPKDYAAKIQPTDAQVDAYYKAHSADFFAPEQARIEYVVLDPAALTSQVKADPTLVQEYYKNNAARYTTPEERSASYILSKVAPNASPADVAKAKALAETELAEVRKNPAAFSEIARKIPQDGGPLEGGDLDFMRKGALGIPALDDALFKMKDGEISDIIRIDSGFQIVKVTGVRGGAVKTFEQVKGEIEDLLKQQEAQKLFTSDAEKFSNMVYEQPDSLDPAAKAFSLTKQTATVTRTPAADAQGPLASPKLLSAIFASDAIKARHNTEAIEAGQSQLVSAHVVEYLPQRTRPLAEVHDQVVDALRKAEAAAAAKRDGEARVAEAKKDPSLALPQAATVGRMDRGGAVPVQVMQAALKADLSKGPTVVGVALPDGGYAAIRVVKSTPHVPNANESAQWKTVATQAYEDSVAEAIYDSQKLRYKVKYNEERIAKVTSQAASAPN